MNNTLRSKVLKMHRLGQSPDRIAGALRVPKGEVDLLVKVHKIVMRPYEEVVLAPMGEKPLKNLKCGSKSCDTGNAAAWWELELDRWPNEEAMIINNNLTPDVSLLEPRQDPELVAHRRRRRVPIRQPPTATPGDDSISLSTSPNLVQQALSLVLGGPLRPAPRS